MKDLNEEDQKCSTNFEEFHRSIKVNEIVAARTMYMQGEVEIPQPDATYERRFQCWFGCKL